jgi:hypothetical protein
MKHAILILLSAFAAPIVAQEGISAEGVGQDGVTSEAVTYDGTGTVQDSRADGDIKVIDVLESDVEVKAEKEKPERGSKKDK